MLYVLHVLCLLSSVYLLNLFYDMVAIVLFALFGVLDKCGIIVAFVVRVVFRVFAVCADICCNCSSCCICCCIFVGVGPMWSACCI